ncbi:MAG TPA: flagellar motor switch protein FliN [Rhodospirillaceae bacterium]|nr:flagellar motor switch protein FliN [Rhodospirillaceae bacterium]
MADDNDSLAEVMLGASGVGREAAYDIQVELYAVLGHANVQVKQLLKLGRGAVVELDRKINEPIDLFVNKMLVGRGEVVVVEDRLGVTVTDMLKGQRGG